jgi:hypothetical protein
MRVRYAAATRQLSCSSAFPARGRVTADPRQRAHGAWLYCYIWGAGELRGAGTLHEARRVPALGRCGGIVRIVFGVVSGSSVRCEV